MNTPVNVSVEVKINLTHSINHALRFLGCSPIIKIDQLPVIDTSIQQGKIIPYFVNVFQDFGLTTFYHTTGTTRKLTLKALHYKIIHAFA
jgi:hypothetical protein